MGFRFGFVTHLRGNVHCFFEDIPASVLLVPPFLDRGGRGPAFRSNSAPAPSDLELSLVYRWILPSIGVRSPALAALVGDRVSARAGKRQPFTSP